MPFTPAYTKTVAVVQFFLGIKESISGGRQKGKKDINILTAQKCQVFTSDFIEGEEIRLRNGSFGVILQMKYMVLVVLFLIYLSYQAICYFITAEPALYFSIPREGLKKVSFLYLLPFLMAWEFNMFYTSHCLLSA